MSLSFICFVSTFCPLSYVPFSSLLHLFFYSPVCIFLFLLIWFLIVFYCNIEAGSKFWNIYFFSFPLYLCLTFPQQAGPSLTHFSSCKCPIGHLPLWWQLMSCAVFVFVVFFSSILPCDICAKYALSFPFGTCSLSSDGNWWSVLVVDQADVNVKRHFHPLANLFRGFFSPSHWSLRGRWWRWVRQWSELLEEWFLNTNSQLPQIVS